MGNRSNKTKISEIVDYWSGRIDECDLSVDWAEAEEYCWNCGEPKRTYALSYRSSFARRKG